MPVALRSMASVGVRCARMRIDEVELRVVSLPFRSPVRTSYGTETEKIAVLATVRSEGIEGYGEGVMEALPLYREESVDGALALLRQALVPWVLANEVSHPDVLSGAWQRWRGNPMAKATLEHAVWDCYAAPAGPAVVGGPRRLRRRRGGGSQPRAGTGPGHARARRSPPGGGLPADQAQDRARRRRRHARRRPHRLPEAALSADANSAYSLADAGHLRALDAIGLSYLEQPLHWDDLVEHAALAGMLATPLCLDESLTSYERTVAALDLGACAVVNLKSGRVGGHAVARRINELCVARSVAMWCGGMYELGVGRAHNIHLATLTGFTLPGDTASASRTYERDIVQEPLEATDGMDAGARRAWHRRQPRPPVPRVRHPQHGDPSPVGHRRRSTRSRRSRRTT